MPQTTSMGAAAAAADLEAHGHRVVVCHPDGQAVCVGMAGERCPLDVNHVDAAVVIRSHASLCALPLEDGAMCAARRGIPLVVGGDPAANPFAAWTAAEEEGSRVAETVQTIVAAPSPHLSAVATHALQGALAVRSKDTTGARVEVHRRSGGLHAELLGVRDRLDRAGIAAASVRVAGALRAEDPWVRSVDVSCA